MTECYDYRLGLTIATLVPVVWYGIPYPIQHTYAPYAVVRVCGNADRKGFGFPIGSWLWSYLNQTQAYNLLSLFDNDTDASADLFVRTYKDSGYRLDTADFAVKLLRPIDGQGKTLIPRSRFHFSNITAQFVHMVEQ